MNSINAFKHSVSGTAVRQRGVVLFFALIALVAMSLAAVALIRSVDTSTLIAGNLALRKSAANSGDSGIESAINWLSAQQVAAAGLNPLTDPTHPLNLTCLVPRAAGTSSPADPGCAAVVPGYHSSINPALILTDPATWDNVNSVLAPNIPGDLSGNEVRYIIQRVCNQANQPLLTADCLYSGVTPPLGQKDIADYQNFCSNIDCPPMGQAPIIRITSRIKGFKSTVSYIQTFVF